MVSETTNHEVPIERLWRLRDHVTQARESARRRLANGATSIQAATGLSESLDSLVVSLMNESLDLLDHKERPLVKQHTAIVAIGGSGRGELAPFSDVDLLFLYDGAAKHAFTKCAGPVVRDCWDAGIKLGHSVRTLRETVGIARVESQVATSLVESRLLWG